MMRLLEAAQLLSPAWLASAAKSAGKVVSSSSGVFLFLRGRGDDGRRSTLCFVALYWRISDSLETVSFVANPK
jgi:hypothetical protein